MKNERDFFKWGFVCFQACGQVEASVGLSSSNGNGIGNMTRPPTLGEIFKCWST